jgi:hypothetical protein
MYHQDNQELYRVNRFEMVNNDRLDKELEKEGLK